MGAPVSGTTGDDLWDEAVLRRVAWRFLPVLICGYFLNYLDRTNIGFAALEMDRDIGLSSGQFGFGAGLFFIAYCLFEVPSNLLLHRLGARLWLARIMITWGLLSGLMAVVVGPYSFYGARILLGLSEAGFFPGVAFFLSSWFPARYRASVLAWFLLSIPLSSLLGGPISGALMGLDGLAGIAGWKWLFLVEGTPTVLAGLWAWRVLSDRPASAGWLSEAERAALQRMIREDVRDRPHNGIASALRDPRVHILALIQFGFTAGSYGVGIWLPLILKPLFHDPLTIGLVSAVPYAFASVAMLAWARRAQWTGAVLGGLAAACLIGAAGMLLSVSLPSPALALTGLTAALVGVTAARALFWTLPAEVMTGAGAAAGFAYINTVAAFGGFAGPGLIGWAKELTGSFTAGLVVLALVLVLTTALVWPLHRIHRPASRAAPAARA